jgi:hypothetical protein
MFHSADISHDAKQKIVDALLALILKGGSNIVPSIFHPKGGQYIKYKLMPLDNTLSTIDT